MCADHSAVARSSEPVDHCRISAYRYQQSLRYDEPVGVTSASNGGHGGTLSVGERGPVLLPIGATVAAENARYLRPRATHCNRLLNIEEGNVRFRWKDYRNGNQQKTMTLSADEFIQRFLLHVLPDGFQRIRYYGFLGNRYRKEKLARCRELLGMTKPEPPEIAEVSETIRSYQDLFEQLTGICLWECPACHQGRMVCIAVLNPVAASPQVIDTS